MGKEYAVNRFAMFFKIVFISFLSMFFFFSCGEECVEISPAGNWRGVLESPGGELPFFLDIEKRANNVLFAGVRNGREHLPFSRVEYTNRQIKMVFDHYDSVITAEIGPKGETMRGMWSRRSMGGSRTGMVFSAEKNAGYRFPSPVKGEGSRGLVDIGGEWDVEFVDTDGKTPAKAIFSQEGTRLEGTFLTRVGDYRFLAGVYDSGILRLSVFDGAHAFLFKAEVDGSGVFHGDFWSRDTYHATWTAVRGTKEMPDPFTLTKLTNEEKRFSFNFPDLSGDSVSDRDPRFENRVLIVYIFGTWCPNCNDEAPFLEELYRTYRDRGLEIVGLANEFTGDFQKDSRMVRSYIKKYGLSWPILIVGIADKKKTAEALSDLDRVLAYPTTLFIDRQKRVQKIYTGFSGPGTGKYHRALRAEFKRIVDTLLKD